MIFKHAIALTGGIGTGKSTVCNILFLNGYRIVDADKIAHKLLDESISDIKNIFGDEYINKDGKVDRPLLGKLIFANSNKKVLLEEFLHPKIRKEIIKQCTRLESLNFPYLVDIPLYFETLAYPEITRSVVIFTSYEEQIKRVISRDKISREFAIQKINSQMKIEKKLELCTYVIDNSKDLKHLQNEVDLFMEKI
ncbi:MAG: Dephospho-CoA kinase (EC [uncultured Campylobacterales bacterium]|uniref:Dephospho-CoA kinase n=1 Tax=uncultured Campylobacterales bacterium TaxID=352960 RepID=A0A6S6S751_9BACT|nr:MAG: Dephospho-CoA kinase (EC [uncultured Campylobacterales bacterium]